MTETDRPTEARPKVPRWVKVLAIIAVVVALAVVVVMKLSGGQHGPGRHLPGGSGGEAPAPTVPGGGGHTPPPGIDHGG
jgi:hypothetical protein